MDMRGAQNCRFAAGFFSGMTQVSDGAEQSDLGRHWRAGVDAPSAHHRPEYPSPGCVPAEPDSVSPGTYSVPILGIHARSIGHRSDALKIRVLGLGGRLECSRGHPPTESVEFVRELWLG